MQYILKLVPIENTKDNLVSLLLDGKEIYSGKSTATAKQLILDQTAVKIKEVVTELNPGGTIDFDFAIEQPKQETQPKPTITNEKPIEKVETPINQTSNEGTQHE